MTLQDYLDRMLQDLQLRGMSSSTQESYIHAVRKISEHYNKLPDQITEDEIREYFLYLKNVKKYGRSASTLAMCGLKFFYTYTLKRDWPTLSLVRSPHEHKLAAVDHHPACIGEAVAFGMIRQACDLLRRRRP